MSIFNIFISTALGGPLLQTPSGTLGFFEWYFYGLRGLGGWLIFLILGLAAMIWLIYDSGSRKLPAMGWRLGVILLVVLLLPTILYRFTVTPVHFEIYNLLQLYEEEEICPTDLIRQTYPEVTFVDCDDLARSLPPMTPFGEIVFYLGLLGGILSPILAVGYFVTYQGLTGCPQGHVYDEQLGECPDCKRQRMESMPVPAPAVPMGYGPPQPSPVEPPAPARRSAPRKPRVTDAWLVDITNDRRYDLYQGISAIGRSDENDIVIKDPAISRRHAQIRESHGHFTLSDIGAKTGVILNGKKLRNPQVMQNGDEITLGDTTLQFVSTN